MQETAKINTSIAQRINQAIKKTGKTNKEVANLIGVKQQSVTSWIKTGNINKENLLALSSVTGTDIEYLISGDDLDFRSHYKRNIDLHNYVEKLNEKQAHQALKIVKTLME